VFDLNKPWKIIILAAILIIILVASVTGTILANNGNAPGDGTGTYSDCPGNNGVCDGTGNYSECPGNQGDCDGVCPYGGAPNGTNGNLQKGKCCRIPSK